MKKGKSGDWIAVLKMLGILVSLIMKAIKQYKKKSEKSQD